MSESKEVKIDFFDMFWFVAVMIIGAQFFFSCTGTGQTIMHALPNTEPCPECAAWVSDQSPACYCD